VLVLEASVAELHQMFLDFALLTEEQGELLHQIEHRVLITIDHIEKGTDYLIEAKRLLKIIRRHQCCIIVTCIVIIGIIVAIVIATQSAQGKLSIKRISDDYPTTCCAMLCCPTILRITSCSTKITVGYL
jgi:t-SNARE complex subunit (syntaxin)